MYRLEMKISIAAVFALAAFNAGCRTTAQDTAGGVVASHYQGKGLTRVDAHNVCGFIDDAGQIAVPLKYQDAGLPSEGLIRVEQAGKWGFVGENGQTVIPPQFDCADDFSDGLARVVVKQKYGYIDHNGAFLIPPNLDLSAKWDSYAIPRFSEGLAPISINGKYGFIDKTGAVVIAPVFAGVEPFSDGLALVNAGTLTRRNFGFIDRSGKMVITPRYLDAESFTEGVACVGLVNEKGFKFGYIDKTGAFVIKPQFDSAASFSEGYAPVSNGVNVSLIQKKSLQAYRCTCSYDPSNEPQGLFIRPPPGDAGVEPDEDEHGTAALIGKDGQPLLKPDHRDLGQFSEGLAPVQFSDGWGYIDTSATVVIAPQFAAAECFANGLARVRTDANGVAFINHQGKVVWKSGK